MDTKWRHDALADDLANHLRGNTDRMVWTNMQMGPSGSPRPDVYTIPKTYTRFTPLAYEAKISVADFRRDVTAGKWQSYLPFSAGVTFAAPAGLIGKADVPPGCGLMVRGDDGWRTLKAPTLKHLDTLPKSAWMKLLINGVERAARLNRREEIGLWTAEKAVRRKYGAKLADLFRDVEYAELKMQGRLGELNHARATIEAEIANTRKAARERAEQDDRYISDARAELCQALGVDPNASIHTIRARARELAERLNENEEIVRLRGCLSRVGEVLERSRPVDVPEVAGA